jgi:hypothetical protein
LEAAFESAKELKEAMTTSILDGDFSPPQGPHAKNWQDFKTENWGSYPHATGAKPGTPGVFTGMMANSLATGWTNDHDFAVGAFYTPHYSNMKMGGIEMAQEAAIKDVEETNEWQEKIKNVTYADYVKTKAKAKYYAKQMEGDYVKRVKDLPDPKDFKYPKPGGTHTYSQSWSNSAAGAGQLDMPLLVMFLQKYPELKEQWLDSVVNRTSIILKALIRSKIEVALKGSASGGGHDWKR